MSEQVAAAESPRLKFPDIELNRLVSEPLKVAELKEGESAIYKLIVADYKDLSRRDQKDNPLLSNPGRRMNHSSKIWDPIKRKRVTIRNIVGYETINTENGERDKVILERIFFKGGVKSVTPDQLETYAFLERTNGNRDNPFRDRSKKAVYYRVNPVRMAIRDMENDLLLLDALNYVSKADFITLKAMFKSMDKTAKSEIDASTFETLKRGIFKYAQKNPILAMKASENNEAKLKIQIMEAEHFNVIKFDEGDDAIGAKRTWFFIDEKMSTICEVELAVHKIDGLIEHFKTDEGKVSYRLITDRLKTVLNPSR